MDDQSAASEHENMSDGPLRAILDQIERCAQGEEVSLGDLLRSFGAASFVSALLVPALLVISPLSGIPFFSSLCGLTIVVISAQMLFRRAYLYLPSPLMRRQLPALRLRAAVAKMRGVADALDRRTRRGRLRPLVGARGRVLPQALCVVAGRLMPLMELVPFSSSLLGAAVLAFSVALLTRDGVFVLVGMTILGGVGALPLVLL